MEISATGNVLKECAKASRNDIGFAFGVVVVSAVQSL